jgi:hypothetical protein
MPFRAIVLLLALVGGVMAQDRGPHASPRQILSGCAAFAPDGTSAAVSVGDDAFVLEITEPSGKLTHLSRPLRYPVTPARPAASAYPTCKDYFDGNSGLVAVGITRRSVDDQLQVAVLDLKTLTWIGDWGIGLESGFHPSLAGFLEETTSIAVTGEPVSEDGRGYGHGSYATLLFDPTGKQVTPMPQTRRIYAHEINLYPTYADSRHNRIWVFQCAVVSAPRDRQPLCPIDSMTLAGTEQVFAEFTPSVQVKKRADLWFYPGSFAVPDSSTVTIAEGAMLWRVDLQTQTVDHLVFPIHTHYPYSEEVRGASAISPDGQVIAVPLTLDELAFPYLVDNYVYRGTDIAVVQVRPLQLLGILKHESASDPVAFAIDHRQGKATVLVYRKDRWERREFDTAPK